MPCFLYYRPKQLNPITLDNLNEWGLGYLSIVSLDQTVCQINTPDGGTGTIFRDSARGGDSALAMNLEQQTWEVCAATGCYVGYWNDQKPTAADLARKQQLRGYPVEMADGQQWLVPLVRNFSQQSKLFECALPVSMKCDINGNWAKGEVLTIHRRLWETVAPFAADFAAQLLGEAPSQDFTENQLYSVVVELLQANYVVGAGELSMLGVLPGNDPRVYSPIYAACDSPTFLAWLTAQKKTSNQSAELGVSTSDGEMV